MIFKFLTRIQIEKIHYGTLEVLERTGVRILHNDVIELLCDAGCTVTNRNVIKIPSAVVEQAIQTAPSRVVLSNRLGQQVMFLEDHNYYYGTGPDAVNHLDAFTGQRRPSVKQDVVNAAKISDALNNIDFVMSLGLVSNCPEQVSDLHQFKAMLENTIKPIVFTAHNKENLRVIRDIGYEVAGSKEKFEANPFLIHYSEVISPLTHTPDGLEKALFCAENMIPLVYLSGLMSGATGPVTTTGAIVQANAEALSSLVIHQLKNPGAPIIVSNQATIMDMKSGRFCHGAPELHLAHAALADIHHHYRLPIWGTAGASDSHLHDQQAAIENTLSIIMAAMSGCNLIHDVGLLDSAMACSLESVVMCDEIIGMVKRILKGIRISDEDMAIDVIHRVGPGGHFISDLHTLEHFRNEQWSPSILVRQNFSEWEKNGKKDMGMRLNEVVKNILETHKPELLSQEVQDFVRDIVDEYENRILGGN